MIFHPSCVIAAVMKRKISRREMETKFGECCICGTPCIWIEGVDGIYYEVEVCDYVCLEKLMEKIKEDSND